MTDTLPQTQVIEQKESIKLIKNSKGYSWEIRILDLNTERLQALNEDMIIKFGVPVDE